MITSIRHTLAGLVASVQLGEVTALIGPNGTGKTTALHALQFVVTGRLEYPIGTMRRPAKTGADVAAELLPRGPQKGEASITFHGGIAIRRLTRTVRSEGTETKETVTSGLDYDGSKRPQKTRPTAAVQQASLDADLAIDPIAWSLSAWLDQPSNARVGDLMRAAVSRRASESEIEAACGPVAGVAGESDLVRLVREGSMEDAIPFAAEQARRHQARKLELQKAIDSAQSDLGRAQTTGAPAHELRETLTASRIRLSEVVGELTALGYRVEDYSQAQRRVEQRASEMATAEGLVREIDDEIAKARAEVARREREAQGPVSVTEVEMEIDDRVEQLEAAQRALNEASAELARAASVVDKNNEEIERAQAREATLAGLQGVDGLCAGCTATIAERAAEAWRDIGSLRADSEVGVMFLDNAEKAEFEARGKVSALAATLDQARAELRSRNEVNAARERAAEALGVARECLANLEMRRTGIVADRDAAVQRLEETRQDCARFAPGEQHDRLKAERAGLEQSIARDERALEAAGEADRLRAHIAEKAAARDDAESLRVSWSTVERNLQALARKLLADGMAPLNAAADEVYAEIGGARVTFDAASGGVDVGGVRFEALSDGQKALAVPAIAIALQRARGCERPMLILDGLESLDRRFELLALCVSLARAGKLHQAIVTWTARPDILRSEIEAAQAIEGVTVVEMSAEAARAEAA